MFNAILETDWLPGSPMYYYRPDRTRIFVVGRVIEVNKPRRFVHTYRFTDLDEPEKDTHPKRARIRARKRWRPIMMTWYVISTLLQLGHVVAAELWPAVGQVAGILGVGIPLVVGFMWAKKDGPEAIGSALGKGFLLGWIPALIGLVLAYFLGHVDAFILGTGSVSSGVAGAIGAAVGRALGKK